MRTWNGKNVFSGKRKNILCCNFYNAEKLLFCLVLSLNNAMIKRDIVHKDLVNKMDMYRLTITSSHKRQQRSNEIVFHEKSYNKPSF